MPYTIVIAPDSYKSSLTASRVAAALGTGLTRGRRDLTLVAAPMADGGEGTLACVAAAVPGTAKTTRLTGIHGRTMTGSWQRLADGRAVIESAAVLGLPLIDAGAPSLQARGSAALGALLRAALAHKPPELIVGLGGSACNDAGLGCLLALGCVGYDRAGRPVTPDLDGLLALHDMDWRGLDPRLAQTRLICLCDVDTPLAGAARVYGPQKGLRMDDIDAIETAVARFAQRCQRRADAQQPGSGAAGGLGFGLACLGAQLRPGAEYLMDMTGLRAQLARADMAVTGEGRSDRQTLSGKLPLAIARAAAPIPTILVSGAIEPDARHELERHFHACHDLVSLAGSRQASLAEPERWLTECGARIARGL